jgi:Tfp pilus assembly ATPase PilU
MPRLWIYQLSFSDGSAVTLAKDDIVLVVGPTNSGKSATLRASETSKKSRVLCPNSVAAVGST